MRTDVRLKRVYEAASEDDGTRILVDRVWPRGISKGRMRADLWLKEAAPSTALRKWFQHDPAKWNEFKKRYFAELNANPEAVAGLLARATNGRTTLVYSARDTDCNQAVALKEYLATFERDGKPPAGATGRRRG